MTLIKLAILHFGMNGISYEKNGNKETAANTVLAKCGFKV